MGGCMLRLLVGVVTGLAAVLAPGPARAAPESCPPVCNSIPASAWIEPADIPLYDVYGWPALHAVDEMSAPRFRFEEICGSPDVPGDPRAYSVHSRAVVDTGHWQLHAQVMHWRGDTLTGGSTARAVVQAASDTVRACQAPGLSPSVTTDEPGRLAVVTGGSVVLHQYLVAHPESSTISELALWAPSPPPVGWPTLVDSEVLDRMTAPLCTAYVSSCG
ncbi:MAG: ATPase [Mycobacterium sp.]